MFLLLGRNDRLGLRLPTILKLGDAIATVAQPIARGIDAVAGTNVAGCPGCNKMKQNLNEGMSVTDAIYERWFKAKQEGGKMKYQFTIVVDDESFAKASAKAESVGEVISGQVKPVPVARPTPQPGMPVGMRPI